MMTRICILLAFMLHIGGVNAAVLSGTRNALILGNATYPDSEAALPTPLGDIKLLTEALKAKGFVVETGQDLSRDKMQAAIDRFVRKVEPGSLALVFFSGYGIQVGRKNYLIPVDARIWIEADVLRVGIGVDALLADLDRRGAGARVVVLDASRRNPFERRFRSFSTGLAEIKPVPGLLALSSAAAGSVVNEGSAAQSPFVAELIRQIGVSEASATQAFTATREALARDSRNQQVPALVVGLDEPFFFDSSRTKAATPDKIASPEERPSPPRPDPAKSSGPKTPSETARDKSLDALVAAEEETARDFNRATAKGTKAAYEDFLRRHPTGALADAARTEVARFGTPGRDPDAPPSTVAKATPAAVEPPSGPGRSPPKPYSMPELQRKAALDARIARAPRDATAYYERGQFHAQRNDYTAALQDFDEAIRIEPNSPESWNNRCWTRAITNDLSGGRSDCDQALKLRPAFVDAFDSRGFVNLKSGALQAAIADYDAALGLVPTHSSALYGRGIARSRLGQRSRANDDLTHALSLNPTIDKDFEQYGLR